MLSITWKRSRGSKTGRKTLRGLITWYRGIQNYVCTGNYGILRGKMAKILYGGQEFCTREVQNTQQEVDRILCGI
jgi:hypothetical protein